MDPELWLSLTWDGEGGGVDGGVGWREEKIDDTRAVVGEKSVELGVGYACLSGFNSFRKMDELSCML